jgi:hypothetical protein
MLAIEQQNVLAPVAVIIEKSTAGPDGLRVPFLPSGPGFVDKADSRLLGHIGKADARVIGGGSLFKPHKGRSCPKRLGLFPLQARVEQHV